MNYDQKGRKEGKNETTAGRRMDEKKLTSIRTYRTSFKKRA
jgi:hypothetical protein